MPNFDLSNYVPVNERLLLFYKDFPNGRVITELIEHDRESGFVIFKASIFREKEDAEPSTTGFAFEEKTQGYVNKTSYIENCETSSVGRALALLGYEITKSIASREEMEKVNRYDAEGAQQRNQQQQKQQNPSAPPPTNTRDVLLGRISKARAAITELGGELEVIDFASKDAAALQTYLNTLTAGYHSLKGK